MVKKQTFLISKRTSKLIPFSFFFLGCVCIFSILITSQYFGERSIDHETGDPDVSQPVHPAVVKDANHGRTLQVATTPPNAYDVVESEGKEEQIAEPSLTADRETVTVDNETATEAEASVKSVPPANVDGPKETEVGKIGVKPFVQEAPPIRSLTLSIFAAPRPYTGEARDVQKLALISWLKLQFQPQIYLVGSHPSFYGLAEEFPGRVQVESRVDTNMYGVPLVNSLLALASAAPTDLSMLLPADTLLLDDLGNAVNKAVKNFEQFVIVGIRWDLGKMPTALHELEEQKVSLSQFSAEQVENSRKYARANGRLHSKDAAQYWLWKNSADSLVKEPLPPFALGRGSWDAYFTDALLSVGNREVIDGTDAIMAMHITHGPPALGLRRFRYLKSAKDRAEYRSLWNSYLAEPWEIFVNNWLTHSNGSRNAAPARSSLHAPWRLMNCFEPAAGGVCLLQRVRPGNCSCEYAANAQGTQTDARISGKNIVCGKSPKQEAMLPSIPVIRGSRRGMPHRLEDLLPVLAGEDKSVVLVGVSMAYSTMLMSFLCRLQQLGVHNVLVAALDENLYRFAFVRGLPVYYEPLADVIKKVNVTDCNYFSECFKKLTKVKSRAVLRILKLGYNVLWTDVDIVWFRNILPELMSYGSGVLPIQSNEGNSSRPANSWECINSGLYFARAEEKVIEAFQAIIKHAAKSKRTEQPSFYSVLCGEDGHKKVGENSCVWKNGLKVHFLDRMVHPNGKYHDHWDASNVTKSCSLDGCATLHNNWIVGKTLKLYRMRTNGFWYYDERRRQCKHDWFGQAYLRPSS